MWLSIIPPPAGLGCKHNNEAEFFPKGVATSPIKFKLSAVTIEMGFLAAGSTVLGRINSLTN